MILSLRASPLLWLFGLLDFLGVSRHAFVFSQIITYDNYTDWATFDVCTGDNITLICNVGNTNGNSDICNASVYPLEFWSWNITYGSVGSKIPHTVELNGCRASPGQVCHVQCDARCVCHKRIIINGTVTQLVPCDFCGGSFPPTRSPAPTTTTMPAAMPSPSPVVSPGTSNLNQNNGSGNKNNSTGGNGSLAGNGTGTGSGGNGNETGQGNTSTGNGNGNSSSNNPSNSTGGVIPLNPYGSNTTTFWSDESAWISCPADAHCDYVASDFTSITLLGPASPDGRQQQQQGSSSANLAAFTGHITFFTPNVLQATGCVLENQTLCQVVCSSVCLCSLQNSNNTQNCTQVQAMANRRAASAATCAGPLLVLTLISITAMLLVQLLL